MPVWWLVMDKFSEVKVGDLKIEDIDSIVVQVPIGKKIKIIEVTDHDTHLSGNRRFVMAVVNND